MHGSVIFDFVVVPRARVHTSAPLRYIEPFPSQTAQDTFLQFLIEVSLRNEFAADLL